MGDVRQFKYILAAAESSVSSVRKVTAVICFVIVRGFEVRKCFE